MNIIQKILWYFSPCRKFKEKDLEGLVACFCTKGIFEKKWKGERINEKERTVKNYRKGWL